MLSQTAEYALRAMVVLAEQPEELWTTERLSETARVPPGYLAKVMRDLGRAGLVKARRGPGGGHYLARPADQINLVEIVRAVQPFERLKECPLGLPQHADALCPLHRRLDEALGSIMDVFTATTIDELLGEATPARRLTAGG